jgi:predicted RNA binding protein YcfA (HicA-like mRNA interferase family)
VISIAIVRATGTMPDVKYRDLLKQLKADGWED